MARSGVVLQAIQDLFNAVSRLEAQFPERRFTLDGHLVGSIGEVIAAEVYGLRLLSSSTAVHDAETETGVQVQVKLTGGGKRIALYAEPEHLIVLHWNHRGSIEEVYDGPGGVVRAEVGPLQKNGQRSISVQRLRGIASSSHAHPSLPMLTTWPGFKQHRGRGSAGHGR